MKTFDIYPPTPNGSKEMFDNFNAEDRAVDNEIEHELEKKHEIREMKSYLTGHYTYEQMDSMTEDEIQDRYQELVENHRYKYGK